MADFYTLEQIKRALYHINHVPNWDIRYLREAKRAIEELQDQLAAERAKVAELQAISHKQQTIMLQAHDEIEKYWDAHTDPTGYGPNTLMNNLVKVRVNDCYPNKCLVVPILEEQNAKMQAVVDAAKKLRINCQPNMSGKHLYSVNLGGTNNKALGELQLALYELLEKEQSE